MKRCWSDESGAESDDEERFLASLGMTADTKEKKSKEHEMRKTIWRLANGIAVAAVMLYSAEISTAKIFLK